MDVLTVILNIGGIFLLVFLNGFFVAAEFAIVKVRTTQIEPLVRSGMRRAQVAQRVVGRLDAYLSASQLGITMTSLGLGWIGEPALADLLTPLFTTLGIDQPALVHTIAFTIAFTIITYLHIVLGEQAPKWMAIQYAQKTTLWVARPLDLFFQVFRPFIWFLNASANGFLRLIGIHPAGEHDMVQSEEELRLILSRGNILSGAGKSISLRAMELRDRTVRQIMVPRTDIVILNTRKSIQENVAIALDNQFTRYPLCEGNLENILGMIHLKDLYRLREETGEGTKLASIKRDILFVPETMSLERILNLFLTKRMMMAIAVDEYGGTAGLVTLENVLEELVGEIHDEFDVEPLQVHKVKEGEFAVDGSMPLLDFSRMFHVIPSTREVVTVSGYIIHLLGRVPTEGDRLRIDSWDAIVESIDGVKVKSVRILKSSSQETEGKTR